MEIDQLRTFLAILEHGSFSRAAEVLHLAQSTVSFQVKALETAAGTRLLDRSGGQVRPTANGQFLRRYAQNIVSLHDEALGALRAHEQGQMGRLTVAASTIPAEFLLPRALVHVRAKHPGVDVVVEVSDSRKGLQALLAQECDVALVGARLNDKRIVYSSFDEDEVILVGPSPNPFVMDGKAASEARPIPLILREEGSGTRGTVARVVARFAADHGGSNPTIEVGSTGAARRCVLEGLGVTFISRWAVEDDLAAGRLVELPFPGTPVRRHFWGARLRRVIPPAAARTLLGALHRKTRS